MNEEHMPSLRDSVVPGHGYLGLKPKATTCRRSATCETQRGWLWIAIAFICGTVISASADAQQIHRQSKQDSPYAFKLGFPANDETIKHAQDATDLRRAIEAYKFFFPTVATEAVIQQFEPHGAVPNKVGIIMPQDPEQQFSVAKQDTPYVISIFDLKDGPIVIEVPEGPFMGLMDDHNMEWFGDMGVIGPGKGKGEKDLLVPPGYEGEIPEGYHPFYCKTWKCVMAMRIVVKSGSYEEAVAYAKNIRAYPLVEAGKPSSYRMIDVKGKPAPLPMLRWEKNMDYWRQLHAVVDSETAQPNHRVMLGMLAHLELRRVSPSSRANESQTSSPRQRRSDSPK